MGKLSDCIVTIASWPLACAGGAALLVLTACGTSPPPPACNTLIDDGPTITAVRVASEPPTALGGPISDGTYTLTALTEYTGVGGPTGNVGLTVSEVQTFSGTISGTCTTPGTTIQQVGKINGQEKRYTTAITRLDVTGTLWTEDICPATGDMGSYAYRATATDLSIYDHVGGFVLEYAYSRHSDAADGSSAEGAMPTDAGAGLDSAVAVADAAVCPPNPSAPAPIPSAGDVSFVITNTTGSDRYVVTQSSGCDVFAVVGQVLVSPSSCPCECGAPPPTFQLALVPNGSSVTVVWDGRSVQNGVLKPVAPGLLTVVVDYLINPPGGIGSATCNSASQGYMCAGDPASSGRLCAGANLDGVQQAQAMFHLPACGGVVVPVALP